MKCPHCGSDTFSELEGNKGDTFVIWYACDNPKCYREFNDLDVERAEYKPLLHLYGMSGAGKHYIGLGPLEEPFQKLVDSLPDDDPRKPWPTPHCGIRKRIRRFLSTART